MEDGIVYDGVVHVVSNVLIPPKSVSGEMVQYTGEELTVEDLKARLEPVKQAEEQAVWRDYL